MIRQVNNLMQYKRTGWLWLAGSFVCLLTGVGRAQTSTEPALNRCGTGEFERILQRRNPDRLRQINELNRQLERVETNGKYLRQQTNDIIYRIPIVVHVVHNTVSGEIGGPTNGNISDEQIISQIQVLNEDYRRQPGTNGFNTSPIGADAGIEFFLATKDPNGQPTNGITRHYSDRKSFNIYDDEDLLLLSQTAYWPSNRYLNIWVTKIDNNFLGFTQFPTAGDTLSGLQAEVSEQIDGSVIDYRYFGRQTGTVRDPSYNLGRTATHEIGHWLGLFHPDGGSGPCGDDRVADTPPTDDLNQTRNCRELYSNCSGKSTRELIENYLMYSPDPCMNMFTAGQVARMRAVLSISPRRVQLIRSAMSPLTETETLTINVYPNPATTSLLPTVDVQFKGAQPFTVDLFDATGRQVRALTYTSTASTRVTLPTSGLASGMYVVRVKTDSEMASKRLLVQ